MIDRLVCADGGNPDPTTTHGKKAKEAKAIDEDKAVQAEVRNVALAVVNAVALRSGTLVQPDAKLKSMRPK